MCSLSSHMSNESLFLKWWIPSLPVYVTWLTTQVWDLHEFNFSVNPLSLMCVHASFWVPFLQVSLAWRSYTLASALRKKSSARTDWPSQGPERYLRNLEMSAVQVIKYAVIVCSFDDEIYDRIFHQIDSKPRTWNGMYTKWFPYIHPDINCHWWCSLAKYKQSQSAQVVSDGLLCI
jgi:hypothetical protein